MTPSQKRKLWVFATLLGVVLADQITKRAALQALVTPGATLHLSGPVDLTLVLNRSNAFGVVPIAGEVSRWGLAALNGAVGALLVVWSLRRSTGALAAAGMAVLAGGAFGNAIDRWAVGSVIDFIDASKIGFHWVFNVADSALDAGIGLLLLSSLLAPRALRPQVR